MRALLVYPQGASGSDFYTASDLGKVPTQITHIYVMATKDGTWTYGASDQSTISNNAHNSVMNFIAQFKASVLPARGVKLYVGSPYPNTGDQTSVDNLDAFYGNIKTFWDNLKASMGTDWGTYVEGCIIPIERIYGSNVDPLNPTGNQSVKLSNDVSYLVRTTYAKKLAFIPYYGVGADASTIINNLGYVVNKMNLFDYCMIQPHWYWDGSSNTTGNLTGVHDSIAQNQITYRDGTVANGGRDHMLCKVGLEMELDTNFFRNGLGYSADANGNCTVAQQYPYCRDRYLQCESEFGGADVEDDPNVPVAFYVGGRAGLVADPNTALCSQYIVDFRTIPTVISDWLNA